MYLFINYWVLFNVVRIYGISRSTFLWLYCSITGLLLIPRVFFDALGLPIFALLMGAAALSEIVVSIPASVGWLGKSLACAPRMALVRTGRVHAGVHRLASLRCRRATVRPSIPDSGPRTLARPHGVESGRAVPVFSTGSVSGPPCCMKRNARSSLHRTHRGSTRACMPCSVLRGTIIDKGG